MTRTLAAILSEAKRLGDELSYLGSDDEAFDDHRAELFDYLLTHASTVEEQVGKLVGALKEIQEGCAEVIPNSGHMYLSIINKNHAVARQALEETK